MTWGGENNRGDYNGKRQHDWFYVLYGAICGFVIGLIVLVIILRC